MPINSKPKQLALQSSKNNNFHSFSILNSQSLLTLLLSTMKQKVVIKLSKNDQKSRSKALTVVVGLSGVESAAFQGEEKDQIEVVGVVDSVDLTRKLRKNIGYAELVTVDPFDKKEDDKKDDPKVQPIEWWPYIPPYYGSIL